MALDKLFVTVIMTMAALIYSSYAKNEATVTVNPLEQLTVAEVLTTNLFVDNSATVETLTGRQTDESTWNLIATKAPLTYNTGVIHRLNSEAKLLSTNPLDLETTTTMSLNERTSLSLLSSQLTTVEVENVERTTTKPRDIEDTRTVKTITGDTSAGKKQTDDRITTKSGNNKTTTKIPPNDTTKATTRGNGGSGTTRKPLTTTKKNELITFMAIHDHETTLVKTENDRTTVVKTESSKRTTSKEKPDESTIFKDRISENTTANTGNSEKFITIDVAPTAKNYEPTSVKRGGPTTVNTGGPTSENTGGQTSPKTDWKTTVVPSVKTEGLTSLKTGGQTKVTTGGLTSVNTEGPTSVKPEGPILVKTTWLTSVKTGEKTSVNTGMPTSAKAGGPPTVKTGGPTSVKTGGQTSKTTEELSSVKESESTTVWKARPTSENTSPKTDWPTTVKTSGPTLVKNNGPTTVNTGDQTQVKTGGPTSVKTEIPTSVKTIWPTSVKTGGPTLVKTGGQTSVNTGISTLVMTGGQTKVTTSGPTSVKTEGPTSVKPERQTSVKSGGQTKVTTGGLTSVKTDRPSTVKTDRPSTVNTFDQTSVKTEGPTSVKTDRPPTVKIDGPTSVKTEGLTSVKTGGETTVKTIDQTKVTTGGPTSVKPEGPTLVNRGGQTSVNTGRPTSDKTASPTSVKTTWPTSVNTGGQTSVNTGISTLVTTGGLTSVKTDRPSTVKTDRPSTINTVDQTSVKTEGPTSVKTDRPPIVKIDGPTSVNTEGLTSVKTGGETTVKTIDQTKVTTGGPTSVKPEGPTLVKTTLPTSVSTGISTSVNTQGLTSVKTGSQTTVKTNGQTKVTTGGPTSVKTDRPLTVKTGELPTVKTEGLTSAKTGAEKSPKTDWPTTVNTVEQTSVKTGGPTSIKAEGPTTVKPEWLTSPKSEGPISAKTSGPTSAKTVVPTIVRTDDPTTIKKDGPTLLNHEISVSTILNVLKYETTTSNYVNVTSQAVSMENRKTSTKHLDTESTTNLFRQETTDVPETDTTKAIFSIDDTGKTHLLLYKTTDNKQEHTASNQLDRQTSPMLVTAEKREAKASTEGRATAPHTTSSSTDETILVLSSEKSHSPSTPQPTVAISSSRPVIFSSSAGEKLSSSKPTQLEHLQSSKATQSTVSMSTSAVITGTIIDRTIKTNYSGNYNTTITVFTTRPTEPNSTKPVVSSSGCEQDMASIDNNRVYMFRCTGLETGNMIKWYEVHNSLSSLVATCLSGADHCLNPDPCFKAMRNGTVSDLRVATSLWENMDGKLECREIINNTENQAKLDYLGPPLTTDETMLGLSSEASHVPSTPQASAAFSSSRAVFFSSSAGEKLSSSITTRLEHLQSSKATQSTIRLSSPALIASMSTSADKINDKTIKANYSGNDNTTITDFTTRPTEPSSTKRVVSRTECEQDMASVDNNRVYTFRCTGLHTGDRMKWNEVHNSLSSVVATCLTEPDHCLNPDPCFDATRNGTVSELRVATTFWENIDGKIECREIINGVDNEANLNITLIPPKETSGHHDDGKTTGRSLDGRTSVSPVITSTTYISYHTEAMSPSYAPTADRPTTGETTRKDVTQHLSSASIVLGERTTMEYRETTPSSKVPVMNRNTSTSNTLGLEATSSTTRNSETTENDQRSVETTEIKTDNGKLTTYSTNTSKTTVSEWNSESTEMSMSNDETTNTYRRSENVTTERTTTRDNERTNSKLPPSLYSQRSNTNPQTATLVISSSVETNRELTSASSPTGVITETETLGSEYTKTTETSVINNVTIATDVPRGQTLPTYLVQGETTLSDLFNNETTDHNEGEGGTTNTISENVETTELMLDSTTNNVTSENVEIVSTAQTPFTKDVSEQGLTASKTVSPAASFVDKSTDYLSTLETSSSGNASNEKVISTERYTSTENVSTSTVLFSPPTSMASTQKKDDQSSGDMLVAAVAGTFSVLAAICLAAAIFFACYKSQKLKNRVNPEITKHGDQKGGVENGLMQEMISSASRQGRGFSELNTKNTTDFKVFVAETSLSRETLKPASRSVATSKGFNDEITAYSFVDERMSYSRSNEHRNIRGKEAVRNTVEGGSGKGTPATKLTLKELAQSHRNKRLVESIPEGDGTVKDRLNGDKPTGIRDTRHQGHEVEVYAVVNKKKGDPSLLKETEKSDDFSYKDVSSEMTDANIVDLKHLRDIYAIVDKSKKRDTLETGTNESDEQSQALSEPSLSVEVKCHLPAILDDEDISESQLDVNKPKTKQILKVMSISSEDTQKDSIPSPEEGVCESDPVQGNHLKQVIDSSVSDGLSEDMFDNSKEPVPKPRLKRLRANVIETRLEQEHLPPRRLSVKDFPGDTGNL